MTLPRHLHRAVLRLLRPAEAATRRLIIVAARDVSVQPQARNLRHPEARGQSPSLEGRTHAANPGLPQADRGKNPPALPLFDPLPRFRGPARPRAAGVPRISLPGFSTPFPVVPRRPPLAGDPIEAARLVLRLRALAAALDDLPSQARRFARWRARTMSTQNGKHDEATRNRVRQNLTRRRGVRRRVWPLRPGRPPGWRKRSGHEVHDVLNAVHELSLWAMERADTS